MLYPASERGITLRGACHVAKWGRNGTCRYRAGPALIAVDWSSAACSHSMPVRDSRALGGRGRARTQILVRFEVFGVQVVASRTTVFAFLGHSPCAFFSFPPFLDQLKFIAEMQNKTPEPLRALSSGFLLPPAFPARHPLSFLWDFPHKIL